MNTNAEMNINQVTFGELTGDICYTNASGNTIKLGEFKFRPEYRHVDITIGDICKITYEGDNGLISTMPNMYWFESGRVCKTYHGHLSRDDDWVINLFKEFSPFTEDIESHLEEFFRKAFDRAQNMPGKETA